MTLTEGARRATEKHIRRAFQQFVDQGGLEGGGLSWLYARTGRGEPRSRYVIINGVRLPTKAFGCLVAQIAGQTSSTANELTTNQASAAFRRAGYIEIIPGRAKRTPKEANAETQTYYQQLARPEQAAFRDEMIRLYSGRCPISGCEVREVLEAAHIHPFAAGGQSDASNGILLRVDLHKLFDAGKLAIDPVKRTVVFSESCQKHYSDLRGVAIRLPKDGPAWSCFEQRFAASQARTRS